MILLSELKIEKYKMIKLLISTTLSLSLSLSLSLNLILFILYVDLSDEPTHFYKYIYICKLFTGRNNCLSRLRLLKYIHDFNVSFRYKGIWNEKKF